MCQLFCVSVGLFEIPLKFLKTRRYEVASALWVKKL